MERIVYLLKLQNYKNNVFCSYKITKLLNDKLIIQI
jgi:hypothetical protein